MNEAIDPAVLSFALAQLRAEGDEDSARHLLESAGLSDDDGDDSEQGTQDATLQAALAALGMGGDAGEDAPVQKAADWTPDEIVAAALQLADEMHEGGEHPEEALRALAELLPHGKAFDESKHPRDHGKFSSKPGASAKTKGEAAPKKPSKLEQRKQRRAEAKSRASALLESRAKGKALSHDEAKQLLAHMEHLTHEDLKELRQTHGATFRGQHLKQGRVDALVRWAKGESYTRRRGKQGSALQQVVDYGGIDPQSDDFKRFYGSMKDAVNDGIPMAAFKRGGGGLDAVAAEMVEAGHIRIPEWEDPSEHLIGLLRGRKLLHGAAGEQELENAYAEHVAGQLEHDDGTATFDPNRNLWDDEEFRKAAVPVTKPGGTRKVRQEGEVWTGSDGEQWTKKNGKIVRAPQQKQPAAPQAEPGGVRAGAQAQPAAQQAGSSKPQSPSKPAKVHGQILKQAGAKKFGLTAEILAKMPEAAVKTIAAQLGLTPHAEAVAPHAEKVPVTPTSKPVLQRAHEWADKMASKHAERVAQHLGISPQAARKVLSNAIRQVAAHALKTGGKASGTLTVGGKQLRLGVGQKTQRPAGVPSKPPTPESLGFGRPENKDGKGSLPQRKAMSAADGPSGGFLVGPPEMAPRRKRKRRSVCELVSAARKGAK